MTMPVSYTHLDVYKRQVFASSGNVQPYKYNGKELDAKKGLNWYDYGARHYDAALGRFTTNDRFAEKYHSMSPYQYGANNRSSKDVYKRQEMGRWSRGSG